MSLTVLNRGFLIVEDIVYNRFTMSLDARINNGHIKHREFMIK